RDHQRYRYGRNPLPNRRFRFRKRGLIFIHRRTSRCVAAAWKRYTNPSDRIAPWINTTGAPDPRTSYSMSAPFTCTRSIRGLQSFSQSLSDEKGVGGLLQAPDLAVSDCPEMGESGLHPPPLLRNAEIMPENDHVIARLEVLVPFRVELVEVGQE